MKYGVHWYIQGNINIEADSFDDAAKKVHELINMPPETGVTYEDYDIFDTECDLTCGQEGECEPETVH